jgi:phosphoribosylformylglycinamidine synthase PurS subunit
MRHGLEAHATLTCVSERASNFNGKLPATPKAFGGPRSPEIINFWVRLVPDSGCVTVWQMKVNVVVKPKEAVLDPQGGAVRDAMRHLGMPEVRSVRIGKFMEIDVDGEGVEVEKRLHGLCRELLSNPVIEDYEVRKPDVRHQRSEVRSQQ